MFIFKSIIVSKPHYLFSLSIILFTFLFTFNSYSIEVNHYYNDFSSVNAIYDSDELGLYICNSSAVFHVDKESKKLNKITGEFGENLNTVIRMFECKNELYLVTKYNLFKIQNGKIKGVVSDIIDYLVNNDKIYVLRTEEPRIKIIDGNEIINISIDFEDDIPDVYGSLVSLNNEIYGTAGTGVKDTFHLFKIENDKVKDLYQMVDDPDNPQIINKPNNLEIVNNEIWGKRFQNSSYLRFVDGEFVKVSDDILINNKNTRGLCSRDEDIIGVNGIGIFRYDINKNEFDYLHEFNSTAVSEFHVRKYYDKVMYIIGEDIYTYCFKYRKLENIGKVDNLGINFIELNDDKLMIAYDTYFEIRDKDKITTFQKDGIKANRDLNITYDKINERIIVSSEAISNSYLQTFKNSTWSSIELPKPTPMFPKVNSLLSDFDGNIFVNQYKSIQKYDGTNWTKIIPKDEQGNNIKDLSNMVCLDSLGGIWFADYVSLYSEENGKYRNSNILARYFNGKFEIIEEDFPTTELDYQSEAITLKNNDVIIAHDFSKEIYYYRDGEGFYIELEDPDNTKAINTYKDLSQFRDNKLILNFKDITEMINMTIHDRGISCYDFDVNRFYHNYFKDELLKFSKNAAHSMTFIDTYGNSYLLITDSNNLDFLIKISEDGSSNIYTTGYLPRSSRDKLIVVNNQVWIPSKDEGLFQFDLEQLVSVEEEENDNRILKHQIITNNQLEFMEEVYEYQIMSSDGKVIMNVKGNSRTDFTEFNSALYFITCKTEKGIKSDKFLLIK